MFLRHGNHYQTCWLELSRSISICVDAFEQCFASDLMRRFTPFFLSLEFSAESLLHTTRSHFPTALKYVEEPAKPSHRKLCTSHQQKGAKGPPCTTGFSEHQQLTEENAEISKTAPFYIHNLQSPMLRIQFNTAD